VYTENLNLDSIRAILGDYFKSFTFSIGEGRWNGEAESSLIIDIMTEKENHGWVEEAAIRIAEANKQESVLIYALNGTLTEIGPVDPRTNEPPDETG
jgi:hypothetical protein